MSLIKPKEWAGILKLYPNATQKGYMADIDNRIEIVKAGGKDANGADLNKLLAYKQKISGTAHEEDYNDSDNTTTPELPTKKIDDVDNLKDGTEIDVGWDRRVNDQSEKLGIVHKDGSITDDLVTSGVNVVKDISRGVSETINLAVDGAGLIKKFFPWILGLIGLSIVAPVFKALAD